MPNDIYTYVLIDNMDSIFNLIPTPHVEEMSDNELSKIPPTQTNFNIIPWNKGVPWSDEHKKLLSAIHIGKTISSETRKKISRARLGSKHSDETKQILSEKKKGENNHRFGKIGTMLGKTHTKEAKSKMKGRRFSEEHKAKLRAAKLGKKLSEEHKKNISGGHQK
jgi:hypothetical protein